MSILAVETDPRGFVILMICWTALAFLAAAVVVVRDVRQRRQKRLAVADASSDAIDPVRVTAPPPLASGVLEYEPVTPPTPAIIPVFVAAAAAGFGGWILSQVAFVSMAPERKPTAAGAGLTPVELAVIMFISAACGWAAAFFVLRLTDTARVAGYRGVHLIAALGAGVLGIFVAIPLVYWTLQVTLFAWQRIGLEHAAKHPLLQSMEDEPAGAVMALAALAAIIAAPLFEELIFRGLIQNGVVRLSRRPWLGIVLSSALFAVIHPWWTIPPIFVLSVLLGYVYHRTQNLWAATLMHALFNAFAMGTSAMG